MLTVLLNTVNEEVIFEYWCKLNEYISGTDYVPPVPEKEKTIEELKNILSSTSLSVTDKALEAFTWGARGQFFWDGNKRTSLLLANQF